MLKISKCESEASDIFKARYYQIQLPPTAMAFLNIIIVRALPLQHTHTILFEIEQC